MMKQTGLGITLGSLASVVHRPKGGFLTEEAGSPPEPWLLWPSPLEEEMQIEGVRPLQDVRLHRKFVRAAATLKGIQRFANRYGLLDGNGFGRRASSRERGPVWGEPVKFWQEEAGRLTALMTIWDLAQARQAGPLGKIVIWEKTGVLIQGALQGDELAETVRRRSDRTLEMRPNIRGSVFLRGSIPGATHDEVSLDEFTPDEIAPNQVTPDEVTPYEWAQLDRWRETHDVIGPAKYWVWQQVNRRIKGRVQPRLLPNGRHQPRLWFVPDDLLTCLYLLFALEIGGQEKGPPRICEARGCRNELTGKRNQKWCGQNCRKLAQRRGWTRTRRKGVDQGAELAVQSAQN